MRGRIKRIASYARALVLGASVALPSGCGEPMVDVVAIWVDGVSDDQGKRHVRIYEAGERAALTIVPDIPGTSVDLLQVGVDGRARGIAVSGIDATVWVDRESGRRVTLSAEALGREEVVAPGFLFTASGDAMLRRLVVEAEASPLWLLASLSGPEGSTIDVLEAPEFFGELGRWSLLHASDAPVLVLAEVGASPSAVHGRVQAWAYPSTEGEGPIVEDLRPLGQGVVHGRGMATDITNFIEPPGCPDRLCLSPSGRQLFAMADSGEACDLLRWSWTEAISTIAETPPKVVELACPGDSRAALVAVLDDELVVFDDPHRIYLVDLQTGQVRGIPKPRGVLTGRLAARGHVLLASSLQGELLRVDAAGPRMINGIQSPCTIHDGLRVSSSGNWMIFSCNGQTGAPNGLDGQVQRVSVLGAELYTGIPMRPIAIDDDGNALLYSFSSDDDDGNPRGLFVLSGDGQLTRVDQLEPFPGRVMLSGLTEMPIPGRFSAAGPS